SGLLNIDLAGEWGPVTIEVLSASGQLVRSERYTSTGTMVIDVPGASGQYLVRLSTGTGEQTTFRILKR
ncbi:MAG: T9SS type A sorting domain-containing protein, partial [Flavobacteriales bacterium]|nr:T9SS type A sorting domain-containing protein [Flavobacteriales bacterium]